MKTFWIVVAIGSFLVPPALALRAYTSRDVSFQDHYDGDPLESEEYVALERERTLLTRTDPTNDRLKDIIRKQWKLRNGDKPMPTSVTTSKMEN